MNLLKQLLSFTLLVAAASTQVLANNGDKIKQQSLNAKKAAAKPVKAAEGEPERTVRKGDVVVEAIRGGNLAPISATTIRREELKKMHYGQDPTAVLATTPNINVSFDGGNAFSNYSLMRIRGLDYSRINITLNGVPLNDMLDQGVFFSNMVDFGKSVRSIQVQRGVGTSTNGTAGYAGSVNFEGIDPRDDSAGAEGQITFGSFGTSRYSAEVFSGQHKGWSFYGRYSALQSNGYRYNSGNQGNSFYGSAVYSAEDWDFKVFGFTGRNKNRLAFLPVSLADLNNDPRTNYVDPSASDDFGQDLVATQFTKYFNARKTLTATAYYGSAGGWFEYDAGNVLTLQNRHYGLTSNYKYVNEKGDFVLYSGLQANVFARENWYSTNPNNEVRIYNNWSRKDETSAFVKVNYTLGRFDLFADLQARYAAFTYTADPAENLTLPTQNWVFVNPKAGVSYKVNDQLNVFASFGSVQREPTRSDLMNGTDNITQANKDTAGAFSSLKPESLQDYELGFNLNYTYLKGQINAFYMDFRNEIAQTGTYTSWFVPIRKNVASSYRTGIEWALSSPVNKYVTITSSGAYTNARIRTLATDFDNTTRENVIPLLTPAWIVNAGIEVKPLSWLDLGLTTRYVDRSYLANNNDETLSIPSYNIFDARLGVSYDRYRLSLLVNNITDQRYFNLGAVGTDFTTGAAVPQFLIQAPRNFFVTFTARF